jgi:hypothetical protein
MAETEADLPDLKIDEELWVELEVPYGKIKEKWDQQYKAELESNITEERIEETILRIYAVLLDLDHVESKEVLLEEIISHDQRWGYNLLCLKQFSDYKNLDFFKSHQDFLYQYCEGTALHSHYITAWESDDKVALTGLLQLFDPEGTRLMSIHALDYCDRKKPRTVSADSELEGFDLQAEAEEIVAEIQSGEFRKYQKWHSFEYDGREYVLIKREIGDDVERQATGNIEEEPATFVALRYTNGELEIISEKMTVANKARRGVNRSVEGVEFESVDPRATTDDVNRTVEGLLDGDLDTRLDELETDIDGDRLTVTGIKLSSSPFPGHPSVRMKTDEGITRTIRALKERDYDLLENIDDVDVIYTQFDGREYSIRPKLQEQSEGEIRWKFTYDARQPPRDEREDFDRLISDMFDINMVFERT